MSAESLELDRSASPLLFDPQPMVVALPPDSDTYAEILLGLRRCFPPAPVAASIGEINAKILAIAAACEAVSVPWKECGSGVSQSRTADLELAVVERDGSGDGEVRTPATGGSRKGRKRRTEEEQEEFWSRRPDWLPEGWTAEVKVRTNGATAGSRDRYYFDPKSGHRFRSRKEVEKFTRTGELPKKPKPKIEESNVCTLSQSSGPPQSCSSGGFFMPYIAIEDVPIPKSGGINYSNIEAEGCANRNQLAEAGATVIGQNEIEGPIGIQQSVPLNLTELGPVFSEKGIERSHQSEIRRDKKGVPKSRSGKKINWKKEARGKRIIQQSEFKKEATGIQQLETGKLEKEATTGVLQFEAGMLEKEAPGVQEFETRNLEKQASGHQRSETGKKAKRSKQSAHLIVSGHEASSSRTKKAPKLDRSVLVHIGREICKRLILANSWTRTTNQCES